MTKVAKVAKKSKALDIAKAALAAIKRNSESAIASAKTVEVTEDAPMIDAETIGQAVKQGVKAKIVFDKTVDFTMDLARVFIEMPEFTGERALRTEHVDTLTKHAKNGTFLTNEACLVDCICKYENGRIRRLNGHHTSWMRTYLPEDWTPKIRHRRYEVETEDEFREIYSLIDRNAVRTPGHVTQSRLYDTARWQGISKRALTYTKNGLAYWLWGHDPYQRQRHKVDEIISLMDTEHYTLCHEVATFCNAIGTNEAFLKRACVMAAILATFAKAKNDAQKFWTDVRTGVGITDMHDPRKTLRDYLQRFRVLGANSFDKANQTPAENMYKGCLYAWNAWRRNEKLQLIKVADKDKRPAVK